MHNNDNDGNDSVKYDVKYIFERIIDNQKEANKQISDINITLTKQHATLEDHTRRSLANEEAIEILKNQVVPIEKHILMVNAGVKLMLAGATIVGACASIVKLFEFFNR